MGIAAWNRLVVIQGSVVPYEWFIGNLRIISIIEVSWSVWPLYLNVPRISFTLQVRWLRSPWGSVLNSYRVQGYRHKVQRSSEVRGRFSAWSFPLTGGRTCTIPWRKLLWEGVSLAMHIPLFKVQPGSLSWFKVTGKRWGSMLVGWAWVARSPTGRRKGHQEGQGSDAEHGEMSAALFTNFLQASCKTHVLLCCIQKITMTSALCNLPADFNNANGWIYQMVSDMSSNVWQAPIITVYIGWNQGFWNDTKCLYIGCMIWLGVVLIRVLNRSVAAEMR